MNSYEYDLEPNRYVSIVKRPDSYQPSIILSSAIRMSQLTIPLASLNITSNYSIESFEPILYFNLIVNINENLWSLPTSTMKKVSNQTIQTQEITFTIAEIMKFLINDYNRYMNLNDNNSSNNTANELMWRNRNHNPIGIVDVKPVGASAVSVVLFLLLFEFWFQFFSFI